MAAGLSSSIKKTRPRSRPCPGLKLEFDRNQLLAFFQRVPNFGEQLLFFCRRGRRDGFGGLVIEHMLPETAKSRRYSRRTACRAHSASCGVQAMQSGWV